MGQYGPSEKSYHGQWLRRKGLRERLHTDVSIWLTKMKAQLVFYIDESSKYLCECVILFSRQTLQYLCVKLSHIISFLSGISFHPSLLVVFHVITSLQFVLYWYYFVYLMYHSTKTVWIQSCLWYDSDANKMTAWIWQETAWSFCFPENRTGPV